MARYAACRRVDDSICCHRCCQRKARPDWLRAESCLRAFSREFAAIDLPSGPHDFRFHQYARSGMVDLYHLTNG